MGPGDHAPLRWLEPYASDTIILVKALASTLSGGGFALLSHLADDLANALCGAPVGHVRGKAAPLTMSALPATRKFGVGSQLSHLAPYGAT